MAQVSFHLQSPPWLWDVDPACWLRKGTNLSRPSAWGNLPASPSWSTRPMSGYGARPTSCLVPQEPLLATVKRRKLTWFRHVMCHNSVSKTILQGTLDNTRRCGQQREHWMDSVKKLTSLSMPELRTIAMAFHRKDWNTICAESPHVAPIPPSVKGLNWTVVTTHGKRWL